MLKAETVEESLAPLCWINWFFGLGVFEFPRGRPRPILSVIYAGFLGIAYFFMCSYGLATYKCLTRELVFLFIWLVNAIVALICVIKGWTNVTFLKSIKRRIGILDETLIKLGGEISYKIAFRKVLLYLTVCFIMVVLLVFAEYTWVLAQFQEICSLLIVVLPTIPVTMNMVVEMSFNILVRFIHYRLRTINYLIIKTTNHPKRSRYDKEVPDKWQRINKISIIMNYETEKNSFMHLIETIKASHLELVRLSKLVNRTYCILLLLLFAVDFTIIVGCGYITYSTVYLEGLSYTEICKRVITPLVWLSIVSIKVVLLNNECSSISEEVQELAQNLRDFNQALPDDELRDLIQQFCMQLILNPIYFSAAGFICLDNNCTRTFFGTVATYLVILIQMSSSPSAEKTMQILENEISSL